jgi:hypothetical protein
MHPAQNVRFMLARKSLYHTTDGIPRDGRTGQMSLNCAENLIGDTDSKIELCPSNYK